MKLEPVGRPKVSIAAKLTLAGEPEGTLIAFAIAAFVMAYVIPVIGATVARMVIS